MEELTERQEEIITHTATAHIACSQREGWVIMPTKCGLKMLWLAILNRTTTCSTSQLSVNSHNNSLSQVTKHGNEVGYIPAGYSSSSSHG
jgi:hypothetical protein